MIYAFVGLGLVISFAVVSIFLWLPLPFLSKITGDALVKGVVTNTNLFAPGVIEITLVHEDSFDIKPLAGEICGLNPVRINTSMTSTVIYLRGSKVPFKIGHEIRAYVLNRYYPCRRRNLAWLNFFESPKGCIYPA